MMYNEEYKNDIEKLYDCQKNEDIAAINDFCKKYYGKLDICHIPDLMRMFNGTAACWEQNEFIVNLLDDIVENYGQDAVNAIVENTEILIEERSIECLSLILTMILFWHENLQLDIISPISSGDKRILELYRKEIYKKMNYIKGDQRKLLEEIVKKMQFM